MFLCEHISTCCTGVFCYCFMPYSVIRGINGFQCWATRIFSHWWIYFVCEFVCSFISSGVRSRAVLQHTFIMRENARSSPVLHVLYGLDYTCERFRFLFLHAFYFFAVALLFFFLSFSFRVVFSPSLHYHKTSHSGDLPSLVLQSKAVENLSFFLFLTWII